MYNILVCITYFIKKNNPSKKLKATILFCNFIIGRPKSEICYINF